MADTFSGLPAACAAAMARHLRPKLFKALCDPKRLALVARLATSDDPLTVTDAASCCGVHISGVSRHLSMLKSAGVVRADKVGREVLYRLEFNTLIDALRGLADALEDCKTASSEA